LGVFDTVLITTPATQSIQLLGAAPRLAADIGRVRMQPCWTTLVGFEAAVDVDFDAAFVNTGPLQWIARNSSKPGRTGGEAWVLHAAADWSESHRPRDREEIARLLHAELARLCRRAGCDRLPAVASLDAHFWGFARPLEPLGETCLFDEQLRLGLTLADRVRAAPPARGQA
jgi:predicted NAD/FAD-dependent oxidoreductase